MFDDAVDDDATADDDSKTSRRGGTAVRERAKSEPTEKKVGIFGRIGRFFREVIGELRKVIWPTRNELLTYTAVVVVFVAIMLTIVSGLDYLYARGVLFVFGNPK
nr:preprotein translocase subunit SecE [Rhizocola hellebori]